MENANGRPEEFEATESSTRRDVKVPEWFGPVLTELRASTQVLQVGQEGVAAVHGALAKQGERLDGIEARVVGLEKRVGALLVLLELFKGVASGDLFKVLGTLNGDQLAIGGGLSGVVAIWALAQWAQRVRKNRGS